MAEYRYYLILDAMTRAFPEQFEKQMPTEFFDNIADLEKRYHQLREMPYNNEREMASITCAMTIVVLMLTVVMHKSPKWPRNL